MLYRLQINGKPSTLLIDVPSFSQLELLVNNPGDERYRLTEIMSIIYPDITKLEIDSIV